MYQLDYSAVELVEVQLAFEAGFYFSCSGDQKVALVFKEDEE